MKKITFLILGLLWSSTALGAVAWRVCQADSNAPFDSNTPVMVGTKLKFICGSDVSARYAALSLTIADVNQNLGRLYARGPLVDMDWTGSNFQAAGGGGNVTDCPTDEQGNPVNEFDMYADANEGARGAFPTPGDWFVIDYNATGVGDCTVKFCIYQLVDANRHEIINPNNAQTQTITLTQVASRDFNNDGRVDFVDFAKLAANWLRDDCNTTNNCGGTDLNNDGGIDFADMMHFAEYWLGVYRPQESGGQMYVAENQSQSTQILTDFSDAQSSPAVTEDTTESISMSSMVSTSSLSSMSAMTTENLMPPIYLTCDNNNPAPGTEVTVYVHSDATLLCMGTYVTVAGNATITDAMKEADCTNYGWDHGWNSDPYIDDTNGVAGIFGVRWAADAKGTIGYFKLHYNGGQVSVSIYDEWSDAYSFDWQTRTSSEAVPFSTEPLLIGHDSNQQ